MVLTMLTQYVVQVQRRLSERSDGLLPSNDNCTIEEASQGAARWSASEAPMKDGFPTCCMVIPKSDRRVG